MSGVQSLAAATLLLLTGCGGATGPDGGGEPIEELPRALTADERLVVEASNRFGFDLLARVNASDPGANHFTSPLSAHAALSMAMNGARDSTLDAMRSTLGFAGAGGAAGGDGASPSIDAINASYRGLADLLLDLDDRVEIGIANSVWMDEGFPFREAYASTLREAFDARVEALDFDDPAAPDAINRWVEDATAGRIPTMIEDIDPLEVLFLLNAIYFKGEWTDQFDPANTADAPFTRDDGTTSTVPMMRRETGDFGLRRGPDATVADLPYGGGAFRYTIVLPPEGTPLADLLADLDAERWDAWMSELSESDVPVHMPKFTLEWEKGLNELLKGMGMEIAFVPGRADFGGMLAEDFDAAAPGTDLHITRVKQKSFLSVDEEGTEAAAATSVGVGVTSAPVPVVVDRPFLLAIRERFSGTIFFLGTIADPGS
ncbi:MAG: serpin family protein [Gemmatimonadota bacterium]